MCKRWSIKTMLSMLEFDNQTTNQSIRWLHELIKSEAHILALEPVSTNLATVGMIDDLNICKSTDPQYNDPWEASRGYEWRLPAITMGSNESCWWMTFHTMTENKKIPTPSNPQIGGISLATLSTFVAMNRWADYSMYQTRGSAANP